MLRKAQFPSVASDSALRSLLAKADPIAEAGNGVCLSSSLRLVDHIWLWLAVLCRWTSASAPIHHDISDLAEGVLLVCRGSPRPGAQWGPLRTWCNVSEEQLKGSSNPCSPCITLCNIQKSASGPS